MMVKSNSLADSLSDEIIVDVARNVVDLLEGRLFDDITWIQEYCDVRKDFEEASELEQVTRMNHNADALCEIEKEILDICENAVVDTLKKIKNVE